MVYTPAVAKFPTSIVTVADFGVFANDVEFILTSPAGIDDDEFLITDATGIAAGMWVPIRGINGLEICQVTEVQLSPPKITVTRGKDGTIPIEHLIGERGVVGAPALPLNQLIAEIAALEQFVQPFVTDNLLRLDGTNALEFGLNLKGATDFILTLTATPTESRTIFLPDANTTLVGEATTNILTNKTIDDDTNVVRATSIHTGSGTDPVVVTGVPGVNHLIRATSATTAVWGPEYVNITQQTSAYSLVADDCGSVIHANGSFIITLPDDLEAGFNCIVNNVGTGIIEFASTEPISAKGLFLESQYGAATIYWDGTTWFLIGDLS